MVSCGSENTVGRPTPDILFGPRPGERSMVDRSSSLNDHPHMFQTCLGGESGDGRHKALPRYSLARSSAFGQNVTSQMIGFSGLKDV